MNIIKFAVLFTTFISIACSSTTEFDTVNTVDNNATVETKAMLFNLVRLAEKGIMFGSEDATVYGLNKDKTFWWYEPGRSDTKTVTGDYPAVYGWEIGDIELGHSVSLDSVSFDTMRTHIIEVFERNGINTLSWHNRNPLTGGNTWDTSSNKVVASILPGGVKHDVYKTWLDQVAKFAHSLKTSNGTAIPIIFRPYHEMNGGWFWWGGPHRTPKQYIALWKFTVEYLRDVKNVNNFLYAFSPNHGFSTKEEYLESYPGDNYVDILGFDCYKRKPGQNYRKWITNGLKVLCEIADEKGKLATFSETGYNNIPESDWWTAELLDVVRKYELSYVLVWRNGFPHEYYVSVEGDESAKNMKKFRDDAHTLFQQELAIEVIYNFK